MIIKKEWQMRKYNKYKNKLCIIKKKVKKQLKVNLKLDKDQIH